MKVQTTKGKYHMSKSTFNHLTAILREGKDSYYDIIKLVAKEG